MSTVWGQCFPNAPHRVGANPVIRDSWRTTALSICLTAIVDDVVSDGVVGWQGCARTLMSSIKWRLNVRMCTVKGPFVYLEECH